MYFINMPSQKVEVVTSVQFMKCERNYEAILKFGSRNYKWFSLFFCITPCAKLKWFCMLTCPEKGSVPPIGMAYMLTVFPGTCSWRFPSHQSFTSSPHTGSVSQNTQSCISSVQMEVKNSNFIRITSGLLMVYLWRLWGNTKNFHFGFHFSWFYTKRRRLLFLSSNHLNNWRHY